MFRRILLFTSVVVTAATGPWWLFVLAFAVYAGVYVGTELLLVAFLIDGYYGYTTAVFPWYTLCALVVLLVVRIIRPHISVYTD